VALKLYWPTEVGVWELDGGTAFDDPMATAWLETGVPLQRPLLKKR
jgi:hypothetical protein